MNKKALIAKFYTFIVATFILAVVLIIFYFIISASGKPKEESLYSSAVLNDAGNVLTAYLNAPVEVYQNKMLVSELISRWYYDKASYELPLKQVTKKILNKATYEYVHPVEKNNWIKAYSAIIYEEKPKTIVKKILAKLPSNEYTVPFTPDVAGVYVPVTPEKSVYVVLNEHNREK